MPFSTTNNHYPLVLVNPALPTPPAFRRSVHLIAKGFDGKIQGRFGSRGPRLQLVSQPRKQKAAFRIPPKPWEYGPFVPWNPELAL